MAKEEKKVIRTIKDSILALSKKTISFDIDGADGVHHLFIHKPGMETMQLGTQPDWVLQFATKCIKDAGGNEVFTVEDLKEIEKADAITSHKIKTAILEMAKPALAGFEAENFPDTRS